MPQFLLLSAAIILVCVLGNKISSRFGVPMLLVFILLGMFFGSDGVVKIRFDNYAFAEQVCSIALIFIMFYGGFGTNWREARPVAAQAILLSTVGVALTAAVTGLFCRLLLRLGWAECFLIGSVISSTDAASVFSIIRSRRLNLRAHTASLLEVESGSNDPFAYMLTTICLSVIHGGAGGGEIACMLFAQIVYGLAFGLVIALAALWVLRRFRFITAGFDAIFVLAVALLAYAAPAVAGGNGYLSAYIVGLALGNRPLKNKAALVHFFDGLTGLMQMLIFFLLGLLAFPSQMPRVVLPALAIAVFLTLVARSLAVAVLLTPFRCFWRQQGLVAWAGLRGASSIVFAITATIHPAVVESDIFHMVFCIVLFSILVQGSLIPLTARKLNMIDETTNVMKTFNDYTEEVPIQFIRFAIRADHPWTGKPLREILLPPDTLAVLLLRGGERQIPRGSTVLEDGDVMILSAKAIGALEGVHLTELTIGGEHDWAGKTVAEIDTGPNRLIIMIQRQGRIVIPHGVTAIQDGDLLVIHEATET